MFHEIVETLHFNSSANVQTKISQKVSFVTKFSRYSFYFNKMNSHNIQIQFTTINSWTERSEGISLVTVTPITPFLSRATGLETGSLDFWSEQIARLEETVWSLEPHEGLQKQNLEVLHQNFWTFCDSVFPLQPLRVDSHLKIVELELLRELLAVNGL